MSLFRKKKKEIKKKIAKGDFDDFDLDLDLGDDFNDEDLFASSSKSRKPISRISRGIIKGLKNKLLDFESHKRDVFKHFPDSVSESYEAIENARDSIADEIRTTSREVRPELYKLAYAVDKAIPSKYARVKSRTSKLAASLASESPTTVDPSRMREDSIVQALSSVFEATEARENYNTKRQDAINGINEKLTQKRHAQTTYQLNQVNESLAVSNAYNLKINTAFQKKLLELQFRSYYVQSDLLLTVRQDNTLIKEMMAGILKNTSLPDVIKLKEGERFKQTLRKEIYGGIRDKLFGKDEYLGQLTNEIKRRVKEAGSNIISGMQGGGSLVDMVNMSLEVGGDPLEDAVAALTGAGLGHYSSKFIKKGLNKFIPKDSELYKKISAIGRKGLNPQKTAEEIANAIDDASYGGGIKGGAARLLAPIVEAIRSVSNPSGTSDLNETKDSLLSPSVFDRITRKSIVNVIPGYLARILQQTEKVANITGTIASTKFGLSEYMKTATPEMTYYNAYTGEFESQTKYTNYMKKKNKTDTGVSMEASSLNKAAEILLENKEGFGAKQKYFNYIKAEVPTLLSQLKGAERMVNHVKVKKDSSFDKYRYISKIRDTLEKLEKFKAELKRSNSYWSIDVEEFDNLQYDVTSILSDVNNALIESGTQLEIKYDEHTYDEKTGKIKKNEKSFTNAQYKENLNTRNSNFQKYRENIRKQSESISDYDRNLVMDLIQVMTPLGYDDIKEAMKSESVWTELKYGHFKLSENDINRLKILSNSKITDPYMSEAIDRAMNEYRKNKHVSSRFAYDDEEIGTPREVSNKARDYQKISGKPGFVKLGNYSRNKIIKGSLIDQFEARMMPTVKSKLYQNITSKTTKEKLDFLIRNLDVREQNKIYKYLSKHTDMSELENEINSLLEQFHNYGQENIESFDDQAGTFTSDRALKTNIKPVNIANVPHKFRMADVSSGFASLPVSQWQYKGQATKHIGPMAQDLQQVFGDTVAPKGKKVDIISMLGLLSKGVGDLKKDIMIRETVVSQRLDELRRDAAKYFTTKLSLSGLTSAKIKAIFDKRNIDVSTIEKIVQSATEKYHMVRSKIMGMFHRNDDISGPNMPLPIKLERRFRKKYEEVKNKFERNNDFIGPHIPTHRQMGRKLKQHTAAAKMYVHARVKDTGDWLTKLSNELNENEKGDLRGRFIERLSKDFNTVVNAESAQERGSALGDTLVTLIAGGVEKLGEGTRFAYGKTLKKIVTAGVDYKNSIKGVGCNSDVYLGNDLTTPVLMSINYRTTDPAEMYYNKKDGTRITSSCHVKGAVIRHNGDVLISEEQIKEHGLYVKDNNGKAIKLGGLKFLAATGINAALKIGNYLFKRARNSKLVKGIENKGKALYNKVMGSRAGQWAGNTFVGRGIKNVKDIGIATAHTLMGRNELAPLLTELLEKKPTHRTRGRVANMLSRGRNLLGNALYDVNELDPDKTYSDEDKHLIRHQKDLMKAQHDYAHTYSQMAPEDTQAHLVKELDRIRRRGNLTYEQKHLMAQHAFIRHTGVTPEVMPDLGKTVKNRKGKNGGIVRSIGRAYFDPKHPFRSMALLAGTALMLPTLAPLGMAAGAGYAGYKALHFDMNHLGGPGGRLRGAKKAVGGIASAGLHVARIPAKGIYHAGHFIATNKTARTTAAAVATAPLMALGGGINAPLIAGYGAYKGGHGLFNLGKHAYNKIKGKNQPQEDTQTKKDKKSSHQVLKTIADDLKPQKARFYQTKVDGKEVRKGGYRWELAHTQGKKKRHKVATTIIEEGKKKGFGLGSILSLLGLGIGDLVDGSGAILGAIKYGWRFLKFLVKIPSLLMKIPSAIKSLGEKIGSMVSGIKNLATKAWSKATPLADKLWTKTKDLAKGGWNKVKGAAEGAGKWVKDKWGKLKNTVKDGADDAEDATDATLEGAEDAGEGVAEVAGAGVATAAAGIGAMFYSQAAGSVKSRSKFEKKNLAAYNKKDNKNKTSSKILNTAGYDKLFGNYKSGDGKSITDFRMAQYGFPTNTNINTINRIVALEAYFVKKVMIVTSKSDGVTISFGALSKEVNSEIIKILGIIKPSLSFSKDTIKWIMHRFLPILKIHVEAYYSATNKTDFTKVNTLNKDKMLHYFRKVEFANGPYKLSATPIQNGHPLLTDKKYIQALYKTTLHYLNSHVKVKTSVATAPKKQKAKPVAASTPGQTAKQRQSFIAGVQKSTPGVEYGGSNYLTGNKQFNNAANQAYYNKKLQGIRSYALNKSTSAVIADIKSVCSKHNLPTEYLLAVAAHESGFQYSIVNSIGAAGLYQFLPSTWYGRLHQFGSQYGVNMSAKPTEIKPATIVAGASAMENSKLLTSVKSPVLNIDIYMIHFLGSGGGPSFLNAMLKNKDQIAANIFPGPAAGNKPLFYADGGNGRAYTLGECYSYVAYSLEKAAKGFGINIDAYAVFGTNAKTTMPTSTKTKAKKVIKKAVTDKKAATTKPAIKKSLTVGNMQSAGNNAIMKAAGATPVSYEPASAHKYKADPQTKSLDTKTKEMAQKANSRNKYPVATAAGNDEAHVHTEHLRHISSSNKEMVETLKQQLSIQMQTLTFIKAIHDSVKDKDQKNKPPVEVAPTKPTPLQPKPYVPMHKNQNW